MPWNVRILDQAVLLEHHKFSSGALGDRGPPFQDTDRNRPRQLWTLPSSAWLAPGTDDAHRWKLALALLRPE